jgi:hypothetical protein
MESPLGNQVHSTGWVVQAWASFILSIFFRRGTATIALYRAWSYGG